VPRTAPASQATQTVPPARDGQTARTGSGAGLWDAQERLWQNEHQTTEQVVALVERDQRISALRAECDWLASQLDEERQRREALEPELDLARGGWTAAEKRATEFESSLHHASARLQEAEISVAELSHQLEIVKTERSEAVLDLASHQEAVVELNLQLGRARSERAELEQILSRARVDLDRAAMDLQAAEALAEESAAQSGELTATASQLRAELGVAVAERDRLQALIHEDHDLAEYAEMKVEREHFEGELRDAQSVLSGLREKVDLLTIERESLKKERTDLQLKIAALRDAHDDSQLQQDNELLRRMVERLSEELKEAQPDLTKRRRREGAGGLVGGLARAVAARVFVPDADVAEGR
jgi:chromosome segregation ATPase